MSRPLENVTKKSDVPLRQQADVVLLMPDGKRIRMTAEEYKRKGKKVWETSNPVSQK